MFHRTNPRSALGPLVALALWLLVPVAASAHAELLRAIPDDGSTVGEPVTFVSGRYSEALVGDSRLRVVDDSGAVVATGAIDPSNDRLMIARPDQPLTAGSFTVESFAFSADGHLEKVEWTFTVEIAATPPPTASPTAGPPSPSPSAVASPSASPTAGATPTASPDPGSPTSGSGDVILPIIAALAIVAIGAGFLLNRGRTGRSG